MSELKHDDWVGTTYGNGWMHRWLIKFLRVIDVRALYAFSNIFVIPPTMLINRKARKAMYDFQRKAFGLSPLKAMWRTYRNHCAFSKVVVDKFAMYAGKKFDISISRFDLFEDLTNSPHGFVQVSSHVGNYEIAGYSLSTTKKRINAMVFGGEKESVMQNRTKLFERNNIRMVPMSHDMSHLFIIDRALADGEILSMPADRIFGSQKAFEVDFFGHTACLPQGPFIMAAMRNVPILFVVVMKTAAKKYHIDIHRIDIPSQGRTAAKAHAMAREYASLLQTTVEQYPEQWYNYFNFWTNGPDHN